MTVFIAQGGPAHAMQNPKPCGPISKQGWQM